jgi:hypothetical protein
LIHLVTRVVRRLSWSASLLFWGLAFGQNSVLRVIDPAPSKDGTIITTEPAIYLRGTLTSAREDARVLWESNRGFSDLATVALTDDGRTVLWRSRSPVPLRPGVNHLRIKALGQPGADAFVNVFYTPQSEATAPALGRTIFRGNEITYQVRDGFAIYQSDIILGKAGDMAARPLAAPGTVSANRGKSMHPESSTIAPNFSSPTGLWPVVNGVARVPYTITNVPADTIYPLINAAITESNTQLAGVLKWEPATASDVNQVNFSFNTSDFSGACEAYAGMVGGTQTIGGSGACTTTTILHEMGHALGFFHEQSRADRDSYVNFMEQNIDKPNHGNFDMFSYAVDSGLYNYASIMEYGPFTFNKDGVSPTLETIPAGMVLGTSMPQYTTGDLDGIMRLYAHAPSAITVDTNPSGLHVIVDGTACTAPCVFNNWTIGSQHTLGIPLDANSQTLQAIAGQNYIFGRWNAGAANAQSVPVTNLAGNGTLLSPSTAPAITNYLASFIPVHPYSPVVYQGNGSITPSPSPSTLIIDGAATKYYQDRQLVTFTVAPASGFSFLFWANVPLFNLYTNPFTSYITSNFDSSFNGSPTTAVVVSDPVTTVKAASPDLMPEGIVPGFAIGVVDGNGNSSIAYTPMNFDATYNGSGFAAGEKVTFSSAASQSPVTTNISYKFDNWTGAGSSVVVPSTGQSKSTANFTPSFRTIALPSLFCPDGSGDNELTVTSTTSGTNSIGTDGNLDEFFTSRTVNFTAKAATASGLSFVDWSQDLTGNTSPLAYSLSGQVLGTANFNVPGTTAPLTITGVSPAAATVTAAPFNLTINGTGFTTAPSSLFTYYVDPVTGFFSFRNNTSPSATQVVIELCGAGPGCPGGEPDNYAGDISTAGYYQVAVLNAVSSNCNPSASFTFPVANSTGPPVLGITKSHTGNFSPGQQNAQYTIQVGNTGTGPTIDPVTVTEAAPAGETLVSMSGSGWTCIVSPATCTRSDALGAGKSYGAINVKVDVAANASSPQVNTATVSGGGAASATATDPTTIVGEVAVPQVAGDTQSAATTAITGAGLVVGTVTKQSSATVAAGDIISETPVAGKLVATGTAVNLVVSSPGTPKIVSVTPNPSTGLSNTFALKYSDTEGASSLSEVEVNFNSSTGSANACYAFYLPANKALHLKNDAGTGSTSITLGSGTLSNSQCTISGSGTSVVKSGNTFTLNLAVTASSPYTGVHSIFMEAIDKSPSSATTGWINKGTWTPTANQPPTVVSVSPNPASGASNTFALVYSDPNGATDLNEVDVVFNHSSTGTGSSCYVSYYPVKNMVELKNDAGSGFTSLTPGSGTLSNTRCTISGSGTSVSRSGDTLTLHLAVTATGPYIGKSLNIYMQAHDNSVAKSGWINQGTWAP